MAACQQQDGREGRPSPRNQMLWKSTDVVMKMAKTLRSLAHRALRQWRIPRVGGTTREPGRMAHIVCLRLLTAGATVGLTSH
eukprot:scaffold161318_cov34-Tisochrysis_lutea.AAC.8